MHETPATHASNAQRRTKFALRTIWPQLTAGVIFAGTLLVALNNPAPTTLTFAVGAGLLFALTVVYLYATQRGWSTGTSLLTWAGGIVLTIFSALTIPNYLPFSVLFVFAAVCYGLGASGRRTMLVGTVLVWLALAVSFSIHLLVMAGVVNIGITNPPLIVEVGLCVVSLLLAADSMQRLWRHYNRTEAAFSDLRQTNEALRIARVTLEQHVHEQDELLEVSRVIRSTQALEPLLDEVLVQMKRVVDYNIASALVLRNEEVVAGRRVGETLQHEPMLIAALIATPHWKRMIEEKQPVVVADMYEDAEFITPFNLMLGPVRMHEIELQHSWMGLPLIVRGEVVGGLSITHGERGYFTPARVEMAFAFANHAAVAIESSRSHDEAVNAAALAERARLARELHDSVSQALYGMVLTTRTSLELIDREPAKARESMRYTLDLADAALSEMRALIFELRPESLKEDGLLTAFRKQAAALTARHKIQLTLELCDEEPALPIKTKEALYRITMEAIQNTIRHAGAGKLTLSMTCGEDLTLTIEDDGCGFDPNGEYPGHLGLQTMRERAHALGGKVDINSRLGHGTLVKIVVPVPQPALPTTLSAAV
jgi:signal transduction histidine kinase